MTPEPRPDPPRGGDPDLPDVLAAQRDRSAFGVIYRRYLDRVYGYCFHLLGDHHDAEDVTERTFVAALAALDGFRDTGATFRSWLFRIAHNQLANALRARSRHPVDPLDAIAEPAAVSDPAGIVGQRRRDAPAARRAETTCPRIGGRSSCSASSMGSRLARSALCSSAPRAPSASSSIAPFASSPSTSNPESLGGGV